MTYSLPPHLKLPKHIGLHILQHRDILIVCIPLWLFLLSISACTSQASTPQLNWETDWLHSMPCTPPCWQGITPGKTLARDVVKILQNSQLIKSAELNEKYHTISWKWQGGQIGGEASYHNPDNQIIDRINP